MLKVSKTESDEREKKEPDFVKTISVYYFGCFTDNAENVLCIFIQINIKINNLGIFDLKKNCLTKLKWQKNPSM